MTENKKEKSDTDKEQPPISASPEIVNHQNSADKKQNKTDKKRDKSASFWNIVKTIMQFLLIALNIVLLYILWNQTNILQHQTNILDSQLNFSQRAWVTVKDVTLSELKEGKPMTSVLKFFNSGNSPASKVSTYSYMKARNTPVPEPMEPIPDEVRESVGIMGSQSALSSKLISKDILTTEDIQEISSGKVGIYVWGVVDYEDVFGSCHRTKFCFKNFDGGTIFSPCPNNNEFSPCPNNKGID